MVQAAIDETRSRLKRSSEAKRRLGQVYALLLRLDDERKAPSAQAAGHATRAPGAEEDSAQGMDRQAVG
jgi:hypothetical protein